MMRRMDAVADSVCNVPCPGDALQNCGAASDYNAVYFISPSMHYLYTNGFHIDLSWMKWILNSLEQLLNSYYENICCNQSNMTVI